METFIGLVIMGLAQICKKWIKPKYGDNGVHLFIALLAVIITGIQLWLAHDQKFSEYVKQAYLLLVACLGTYELIFKKIGNAMAKSSPYTDDELDAL